MENGAQLEKHKIRGISFAWWENILSYRKALKTARSAYFTYFLEENKHNPRNLFNTMAKCKKKKKHQYVLTIPNSTAVMNL